MTSDIVIRPARPEDAAGMSTLLTAILRARQSTRRSDPAHVLAQYVAHPDRVACTVAEMADEIVGFQSLRHARPGND